MYGAVNPRLGFANGNTNRINLTGEFSMNPPSTATGNALTRAASSSHEQGCHFLFVDGHVAFVSENIEHTARSWQQPNPPNNNAQRYDRLNSPAGLNYGLYQRLFSRDDELTIGSF